METIGFIGLGIMGRPMAKNLLSKLTGERLYVSDLNPVPVAELAALGATPASAAEIGQRCSLIITILPSGAVVKDVLFGANGAAAGLKPGALVIDMSSVTPGDSKDCAAKLSAWGASFLDAPVSGGEPGAVAGSLAIMCGGAQADFDRAVPYFGKMGKSWVLVGGVGSGSVTKLANQAIVNLTIAAVGEAFVLAQKAGADTRKVFEAIRGGLAASAVLEDKAPRMLRRDFVPGGKLSINRKDIGNVLAAAHELDCPAPFSALLYEAMQSLKASGNMDDDHSATVKFFERLAGVEVGE